MRLNTMISVTITAWRTCRWRATWEGSAGMRCSAASACVCPFLLGWVLQSDPLAFAIKRRVSEFLLGDLTGVSERAFAPANIPWRHGPDRSPTHLSRLNIEPWRHCFLAQHSISKEWHIRHTHQKLLVLVSWLLTYVG